MNRQAGVYDDWKLETVSFQAIGSGLLCCSASDTMGEPY